MPRKASAVTRGRFQRTHKPDAAKSLMAQCVALGLPVPVAEWRFHPTRRFRFDLAWTGQKVALEIDGGIWVNGRHSRGSGRLKDMEKFNLATERGWRCLWFTPEQARDGTAVGFLLRVLQVEGG